MGKSKYILLVIPCIFFIIWSSSLAKCEVLTILHYDEFCEKYKENTMMGEIDYLKILEYNDQYARIYVVSANKGAGNVLRFSKENGEWRYDIWEKTVWSDKGSASEVIWPYWWHFIYGGL